MPRLLATVASVLLAAVLPGSAQSLVYTLESGRSPIMCSIGGCHAPTIHLINAATGHELSTVVVGSAFDRGTSMRLSADGTRLFVTSVPHSSPTGQGALWVVDAVNRALLGSVPVGNGAADVAVSPDNSRAYVVNTNSDSVSIVDLTTRTVITTVAVQTGPSRIAAAPAGNAIYVVNGGSNSISKISTLSNSVDATIPVGATPTGIDVSPDGSHVFVANSVGLTVTVIDATTDSVLGSLPAGSPGAPPLDVSAPSPTRVFVTLSGSSGSAVELLDAANGTVLGSTSVLPGARLARSPSGSPTYVIETATTSGAALRLVAADGSATTPITARTWTAAAVLTEPCAFEASATPQAFGPAGGSGTLTIPAPAGCSWTVDTSRANNFTFEGTLSGTGPATRTYSIAAADAPTFAIAAIARQTLTLEQTIPRMNVETPASGGRPLQQPFVISGWALEQNLGPSTNLFRGRGIDVLHIWAHPASGAAPLFVGATTVGYRRTDVSAIFGNVGFLSGFRFTVTNLPSGPYTLVVYAHSEISNTFVIAQPVNVTVAAAAPIVVIDTPANDIRIGRPFPVGGWALDPAATSGTGIDFVHVWAYPSTGAAPVFVGAPSYGSERPDVGAFYGSQFTSSGYSMLGSLPPGRYMLVVFAHSTASGQFVAQTATITVPDSDPLMVIDVPTTGTVSTFFDIFGWALDRGVTNGNSTDAIHVWAYLASGGSPIFVGAAQRMARPDVAAIFGATQINAGFALRGTLPAGTYDLVVFARSVLTQTFNNAKVVRITVQ